jgi:hypothetical protein
MISSSLHILYIITRVTRVLKEMAVCRRDCESLLRSVPGGNLQDSIRSSLDTCPLSDYILSDVLTEEVYHAGASSCSLCQAGTYRTGSGPGARFITHSKSSFTVLCVVKQFMFDILFVFLLCQ